MSGPLEGVKIIDITTVLMGPYATQILGELGADVIKVESPAGDNVRNVGASRNPGMAGIFLHVIATSGASSLTSSRQPDARPCCVWRRLPMC
jgi:crotonobetainyl-CoA:carnitine CoA-transferase CaiB-like acyl-CoA transferase